MKLNFRTWMLKIWVKLKNRILSNKQLKKVKLMRGQLKQKKTGCLKFKALKSYQTTRWTKILIFRKHKKRKKRLKSRKFLINLWTIPCSKTTTMSSLWGNQSKRKLSRVRQYSDQISTKNPWETMQISLRSLVC